jgi:hypothetical protein
LIFAAYFLEAGIVLMMAPWSAFWERNAFAQAPMLAEWLSNAFFRGAVSGIGLITAIAGLAELAGAFRRRQADAEPDEQRAG